MGEPIRGTDGQTSRYDMAQSVGHGQGFRGAMPGVWPPLAAVRSFVLSGYGKVARVLSSVNATRSYTLTPLY